MPRPKGLPKTGGRQPGSLNKATIEKEQLRELVRQRIAAEWEALVGSQIAHARGLSYLVTRDKKTGKFIRVAKEMAENAHEDTIEVWAKEPSTQAFTDLMNRMIDKPADQEQLVKLTGDADLIAALQAGRQRVAAAKGSE
jgi:hypothetical protein